MCDVPSPREPSQTVAPTTSRKGKRTTSCALTPPLGPYTAWQRRVRPARSCARTHAQMRHSAAVSMASKPGEKGLPITGVPLLASLGEKGGPVTGMPVNEVAR